MAKRNKRQGRGWQSSIKRLPEDVRVGINADLREDRMTQTQILEKYNHVLMERGLRPSITKSSLNRYSMQVEKKGAMMREARAAADALVGGLGEHGGTDLGRAVTELVKTLTFDLVVGGQDGDGAEPIGVDVLGKVALIAQRIERASKISLEREIKIREEAQAAAVKAVEAEAKRQGTSAATIDSLRAAIMEEMSS